MTLFIAKFKKYFMYVVLSLFALPFIFGGHSQAQQDLLQRMSKPAMDKGLIIDVGSSVSEVGSRTIKDSGSIVVRVTRYLLVLTIALSVTMILYNGMIYIIETGQGKEGKSLAKNVILIVVGILIALFSSIIITLIQSVPETTIDTDTKGSDTDVL